MDTKPDRVVMIDDQVSFVDAFGLALSLTDDLKLVGRASDGAAGLDLCTNQAPDLIMTDYRLPDGQTGTKIAAELRSAGCSAPVIVLTGFLAPQVQREVDALDDVTAISKDNSIQNIVTEMRSTIAGRSPDTAQTARPGGNVGLTVAELEVLEALNTGAAPNDIAELLHLSVHTVRGRIKSIYRKLSVGSLGEAIATATRLGVLVPPT